jgi:RecA/RadA recombinase
MTRKKKDAAENDRNEDIFAALKETLQKISPDLQVFYGKEVPEMDVTGRIPTPLTVLNVFLGGGIARGRITEIYGGSGDGKTAFIFALQAIHQKMGGKILHWDLETSMNSGQAVKAGVDVTRGWLGCRATCIEDVFSGMDRAIVSMDSLKDDCPLLITWDSLAATPPRKALEDEKYEDESTYYRARVISRCLNKFAAAMTRAKATVVIVNQTRIKVEHNSYKARFQTEEDKVTPIGGKAREYAMTTCIQITRKGSICHGEGGRKTKAGIRGHIYITKNREGIPFGKFPYRYYFSDLATGREGFDDEESTLAYLQEVGVLEDCKAVRKYKTKTGAIQERTVKALRLKLEEDKYFTGFSLHEMAEKLRATPEVWKQVQEKVRIVALGLDLVGKPLYDEDDPQPGTDDLTIAEPGDEES